jgi:hypothetical protein
MAQRRIGGDAGAKEGGDAGERKILRDGVGVALVDDVIAGVAPPGDGTVEAVGGVVGLDHAFNAEVLLSLFAGVAVPAGVDDDADGRDLTGLEPGDTAAGGGDTAYNLVTGNHGKAGESPLVSRLVEIGVANPAIEDIDGDIGGTGLAAGEGEGGKRRLRVERGITFG